MCIVKFSLAHIKIGPEILLVCMVTALSEIEIYSALSSSTDMVCYSLLSQLPLGSTSMSNEVYGLTLLCEGVHKYFSIATRVQVQLPLFLSLVIFYS